MEDNNNNCIQFLSTVFYFILFYSALSRHTFRRSLGRDGRSEKYTKWRIPRARFGNWSQFCLRAAAERELAAILTGVTICSLDLFLAPQGLLVNQEKGRKLPSRGRVLNALIFAAYETQLSSRKRRERGK